MGLGMSNINQPTAGTIVRTWTGWIRSKDRAKYNAYLEQTGLREYRETPGNIGAYAMFRDVEDDRAEIVTVSLWIDIESITAFAGDTIADAVFYPEDDRFLVDRETTVKHYAIS